MRFEVCNESPNASIKARKNLNINQMLLKNRKNTEEINFPRTNSSGCFANLQFSDQILLRKNKQYGRKIDSKFYMFWTLFKLKQVGFARVISDNVLHITDLNFVRTSRKDFLKAYEKNFVIMKNFPEIELCILATKRCIKFI
jgi:hypothetical protein